MIVMALVNGKPLKQVLKELEAEERRAKKLDNKYEYYKIEQYEKRLNDVVGRVNWRARYEGVPATVFPNGQVMLEKKCVISLLDEVGNEVISAEGFGGVEVKRSSSDGSYLFLGNAPGNAKIAAFKDALRSFNIFGIHTTEDEASANAKASSRQESEAKPDVNMSFLTEGIMEIAYTDQRAEKPVYRLAAHEVVGKVCREKTCDILFYPNQYKGCVEKLNGLISSFSEDKPKKVSLKVKQAAPRDGVVQYVFKGFV